MNQAEASEILQRHVSNMSEHFDAIQVLVTWFEGDGVTRALSKGSGNYYARVGMAKEFVVREDAAQLCKLLGEKDDDNGNED
jgi:hypothetical protein